MFETPNIVRLAVGIYVLLGVFVVFSLWWNAAATDATQNTGIVLAGLLPALIAVLPYLEKKELKREFVLALFFDEATQKVVFGDVDGPYVRAYHSVFANLNDSDFRPVPRLDSEGNEVAQNVSWPDFHSTIGWDLIERALLNKISTTFLGHWDMEFLSPHNTPHGTQRMGKMGRGSNLKLPMSKIASRFNHNRLIRDRAETLAPPFLNLPPESEVRTSQDEFRRDILIINRFAKPLRISTAPSSGGIAPRGVWGVLKSSNGLHILLYSVEIVLDLPRWSRSPEAKPYVRWFDNIAESLAGLDWNAIDQEIERGLFRQLLLENDNAKAYNN